MNLLELMLKDEIEWPVGAKYAAQDGDLLLSFYTEKCQPFMRDGAAAWDSDGSFMKNEMINGLMPILSDKTGRVPIILPIVMEVKSNKTKEEVK